MVYVYEDEGSDTLYPLVDLRPVFDLRCGRFTLLEKLRRRYPREGFGAWVRESHAALAAELHPGLRVNAGFEPPALFLSARAIFDEKLPVAGPDAVFTAGSQVVGFRLNSVRSWQPGCLGRLQLDLPGQPVKARVITWPWDLVEQNPAELEGEATPDMTRTRSRGGRPKAGPRTVLKGVTVVGPRPRLHVSPAAHVWPGTVISTETGPVFIDDDARVRPHSFIEGPCFIGPGTVIDAARLRPGCSFGPRCRIGGEVEASVFQGFANKHHDGFTGHSFVGEWVNLGALTTSSDLRNDYTAVKVMRGREMVDTALLKVGCFVGDHAKTAIGTLLNSGTTVGTFANWFKPGLSQREILPFSLGAGARQPLADVLHVCRQVMSRRGRTPGPAYVALLTALFERCTR